MTVREAGYLSRMVRRALRPPTILPRAAARYEPSVGATPAMTVIDEVVETALAGSIGDDNRAARPVAQANSAARLHSTSSETMAQREAPVVSRAATARHDEESSRKPMPAASPDAHAAAPTPQHSKEVVSRTETQTRTVPLARTAEKQELAGPILVETRESVRVLHESIGELSVAPRPVGASQPAPQAGYSPRVARGSSLVMSERERGPAAEPLAAAPVEVFIGRIEIRASDDEQSSAKLAGPASAAGVPKLSLDSYLRVREGRRS